MASRPMAPGCVRGHTPHRRAGSRSARGRGSCHLSCSEAADAPGAPEESAFEGAGAFVASLVDFALDDYVDDALHEVMDFGIEVEPEPSASEVSIEDCESLSAELVEDSEDGCSVVSAAEGQDSAEDGDLLRKVSGQIAAEILRHGQARLSAQTEFCWPDLVSLAPCTMPGFRRLRSPRQPPPIEDPFPVDCLPSSGAVVPVYAPGSEKIQLSQLAAELEEQATAELAAQVAADAVAEIFAAVGLQGSSRTNRSIAADAVSEIFAGALVSFGLIQKAAAEAAAAAVVPAARALIPAPPTSTRPSGAPAPRRSRVVAAAATAPVAPAAPCTPRLSPPATRPRPPRPVQDQGEAQQGPVTVEALLDARQLQHRTRPAPPAAEKSRAKSAGPHHTPITALSPLKRRPRPKPDFAKAALVDLATLSGGPSALELDLGFTLGAGESAETAKATTSLFGQRTTKSIGTGLLPVLAKGSNAFQTTSWTSACPADHAGPAIR